MLFKLEDIPWNLVTILLCSVLTLRWYFKRKLNLPPGPVSLPLVGYLPFLGSKPFITLNKLGKTYGNVFSLYLGTMFTVVLNDIDAIKEALQNASTTNRPIKPYAVVPGGLGLAGANGAEWAEQRRFTFKILKIQGFDKNEWEQQVKDEAVDLLNALHKFEGHEMDMDQLLTSSTSNNIWSFVFGKRLPIGDPKRVIVDRCVKLVPAMFRQTGGLMFFPALFDIIGKLKLFSYGESHKALSEFNAIIKAEVLKRKGKINDECENTYIDEYLKEITNHGDDKKHSFSEEMLIGNVKSLLIAGSDTTKISFEWLLLAMAEFPEKQQKVHQELDDLLDRDGMPSWEHRTQLPYTFAVILESHRWTSMVPLGLVREAREDITIGCYDVPKGSLIVPNMWSAHNDERYWINPGEFYPERFLEDDGKKVISTPESFVPFSMGKRGCPGETVALIEVFIFFTAIMLQFDIRPPTEDKALNLEGRLGANYEPNETRLRFVPRQ